MVVCIQEASDVQRIAWIKAAVLNRISYAEYLVGMPCGRIPASEVICPLSTSGRVLCRCMLDNSMVCVLHSAAVVAFLSYARKPHNSHLYR